MKQSSYEAQKSWLSEWTLETANQMLFLWNHISFKNLYEVFQHFPII